MAVRVNSAERRGLPAEVVMSVGMGIKIRGYWRVVVAVQSNGDMWHGPIDDPEDSTRWRYQHARRAA